MTDEEVQVRRRDFARDRAFYRATFEIIDEDVPPWEWRCKICGATVHDWGEATEQHLDVNGPGPIEDWWSP